MKQNTSKSAWLQFRGERTRRSTEDAAAEAHEFRQYVYQDGHPRAAMMQGRTAREYTAAALATPRAAKLYEGWVEKYHEPLRGLTTDGTILGDVYDLGPVPPGLAAPTIDATAKAWRFLDALGEAATRVRYDLDAPEFHGWSNPEWVLNDTGIRLEEMPEAARSRFLELVAASLSPAGAQLISRFRWTNEFLGSLLDAPGVMNQYSYHVAIYGTPSTIEPWGWQMYGHHVAVNVVFVGERMSVSPVFLGAEPTVIDEGEHAGVEVFTEEVAAALRLVQSLDEDRLARARIYPLLRDPAMPEGRLHAADERMTAGCFCDNEVVPYEGIIATDLGEESRELLWALVRTTLRLLPAGPLELRMREIRAHAGDTWFTWIGATDGDHPAYYRVQSPVLFFELDPHAGLFLTNDEPAPFHLHTIIRQPNGNDYGRVLIEDHRRRA